MDKGVIEGIIRDAVQEANNRAEDAFEEALKEYNSYRGEYYEDEIYSILPYIDEYGVITEAGRGFPFNIGDDFSNPFMNGKIEQRLFPEEENKIIDDYNVSFAGGDLKFDAMRVATAIRFYKVLEAIKRPYNEPHSENYMNFIENLRHEINYNPEKPEELVDNRLYILRKVLERENSSYYEFMKDNIANLIDYNQIISDAIKNDSRLDGENIDIDVDDINARGTEYAATKAIINHIKPDEFDKDMMKILYTYNYQGNFNNPMIARMYRDYVEEQNAMKEMNKDKKTKTKSGEENRNSGEKLEEEKHEGKEEKNSLEEENRRLREQLERMKHEDEEKRTALEEKNRILREQLEQMKHENTETKTKLEHSVTRQESLSEETNTKDEKLDEQKKIMNL